MANSFIDFSGRVKRVNDTHIVMAMDALRAASARNSSLCKHPKVLALLDFWRSEGCLSPAGFIDLNLDQDLEGDVDAVDALKLYIEAVLIEVSTGRISDSCEVMSEMPAMQHYQWEFDSHAATQGLTELRELLNVGNNSTGPR